MAIIFKYNVKTFILFFTFLIISCDGTLGGFDNVSFPVSKKRLEVAIDSLYSKHTEYVIPEKWQKYNDWSKRGYDFLESEIFYFKEFPEEMYYVSYVGDESTFKDSSHVEIAIRAISVGDDRWLLKDDLKEAEIKRIETRFENEIVSKLKKYINNNDN